MSKKQHMLIIMDGVGLCDEQEGNAFKQASTPNIDRLINEYPNSSLECKGLAVGLPVGQMGNSEVGHMSIGAGRVIYQDLTLITKEIEEGEFFKNKALLEAINHVKENNSSLHLMGLLSDGGVHSHINHLYALLKLAKDYDIEKVYIHAFMDGRDTPPTSGMDYLKELEEKIKEIGIGKIATISGRYYAMDRDNRWERETLAYNAMVFGEGNKFKTVQKAIENSYEAQEFDEFVKPIVIVNDESEPIGKIENNDSCIFFNFRPDRAREITRALTDDDFDKIDRRDGKIQNLKFITMTEYDETIKNVKVAYKKEQIVNTLGEYLSKKDKTQLRIAETEKYAHVTFFFNGGEEKTYKGEDRILIESPKVPTYDEKPEMSAYEITDKVIEAIKSEKYDLIIMNFANGDMVGHTGNMDKTIEAVEAVDKCLGRIIEVLEEVDGEAVVTADHGNCEQMVDLKTGEPVTSHTTNRVPIIVTSKRVKGIESGALTDLAPTVLALMGLEKPKEMTGKALIRI